MATPFLGEIDIFPYNFAPLGWATCNGQILSIAQNTALFSLLGTQFGGDGKSTFALPNFQGGVAVGQGQGPGLSPYSVGESGGSSSVTLLQTEIPSHDHGMNAVSLSDATSTNPAGSLPATLGAGGRVAHDLYATGAASTQMLAGSATSSGGSGPHNNVQPYLTLQFCIALQGVYPERS